MYRNPNGERSLNVAWTRRYLLELSLGDPVYLVQVAVRTEALNCIGRAYSLSYPELYL